MADDKITTERTAEPATTAHTTIIRERGSSGGGMGIFFALVLLIAVIGGIYIFSQNSASENAKNNAIADAASDVGNAASKVGSAAENAAQNVNPD